MNSSLLTADGTTHLKILVVGLVAGILVIWIGVGARPRAIDNLSATPRLESNISEPDYASTDARIYGASAYRLRRREID